MAMSLEKLDRDILTLAGAGKNTIEIRRASAPTPQLMTALGPLTSIASRDATVKTAVAMNFVLGRDEDHALAEAMEPLRAAVQSVSTTIRGSHTGGGSAGVSGLADNLKKMEPIGLLGAIDAAKKGLPDTQQSEVWAKVIDAALATALTMVPFAGPILAAFCLKGLNGAIGAGAGMASGQIGGSDVLNLSGQKADYNSNYKAGTTGRGGELLAAQNAPTNFLGQIDISKATPGSLIVEAIRAQAEKKRNKELDRLTNTNYPLTKEDHDFREEWHNTFDRVMNPVTQDQVAQNKMLDGYKLKLNLSGADASAGTTLANALRTPSKTVEDYAKKVSTSLKSSVDILKEVVGLSIMASFAEELDKYKIAMQMFPATHPGLTPHYPYTGTPADKGVEWHLALLIIAYYYNLAVKTSGLPLDKKHPLLIPFDSIGALSYVTPGSGGGTNTFASFTSREGTIADKDVKAFTEGRSAFAYESGKTLTRSYEPIQKIKMVSLSIEKEATAYVNLVKNAMVRGVTQALQHDNTNYLTEIITVFGAANIIVNAVWAASLSGKKGSTFKIPLGAVEAFKKYELVNIYSTWNKRISDKDKLGKIGAKISDDGKTISWNPAEAKLRWYNDSLGGASDSEKLMMYIFARGATEGINLFNLVTGVEKWEDVKASLRSLIADINEAAHKAEWNAIKK